ncbi:hypothetical protein GGQ88_003086 [Novosphingobium hassiacum]|uniref:Uncharacterized protein n=1 Tax=Novosphingobium hassiacum TaxID=173676 RepID=A0A7W6EWY9_9SPHN|nr:hypothetical protein [Novosphingobium hassiacum]
MIALSAVLLGWAGVRMLIWTPLFESAGVANAARVSVTGSPAHEPAGRLDVGTADIAVGGAAALSAIVRGKHGAFGNGRGGFSPAKQREALFDLAKFTSFGLPSGKARSRQRGTSLMGALPVTNAGRWSADGWLLLRGRGGDAAQAPGAASYGASQAGAVLRYRLGDGGGASPYAYMRASYAVDAPGRDREAALGLGIRPVVSVPLRALVEVRAQDSVAGPVRVRPVVSVVTELPWQDLPLGLRGEVYAQAGYAGGREGTAFFDAQALVDRPVAGVVPNATELRVGAGVWAGGQRDAARIDIGPRVTLGMDLGGQARGRVALDWRFRVGGNARPGSGPALTVASSF